LKFAFIIAIVAVIFVTGIVLSINVSAEENLIPSWVKNVAGFWANDDVSEKEFMGAIEYLIDTGVVNVPEIANLKMEKTKMLQDKAQDKKTILELTRENVFLKKSNNEFIVMLDEAQVILEDYLKLTTTSAPTSEPESIYLSGQSVPDKMWGYVDAEYYDNRYERLNVKIHTSDKFENDFVFKQGRVDVVVWYEAQHGVSVHGVNNNPDYSHLGNKDVVVIEHTVEFSESDYSYDNKLIFNIEGCLAEDVYFVQATIWSDMGNGFTFDTEFTVDSGSC
jgi:hypothetical protein